MRFFYSFLFYLALPYIFIRLLWRSIKQPAYRQRLGERLGFYPYHLDKCLWVHAVSMGETIAATPLIKELQARYPHLTILVTTMTPTGAEKVKSTFQDSVRHAYLPYDLPTAVARFLRAMNPVACIIMETEMWPNVIAACERRNIPCCLVNARLSPKSAAGYQRIASITKQMLQSLAIIAAHGYSDAERFLALGAPKNKLEVTGNLKFDITIPEQIVEAGRKLRGQLGPDKFIWIAASTHEGEEEIILAAHKELCSKHSNALLILVPRHPDRFNQIAKMSAQQFKIARRSLQQTCTQETQVYLGDTMGELLLLYAASDVAFVGGSLITRGGHNILEPAALEKPLLSGPHLFNFAEISELFIQANALHIVHAADDLAEFLHQLIDNPELQVALGQKSLEVVNANRGALQKQLNCIDKVLKSIRT